MTLSIELSFNCNIKSRSKPSAIPEHSGMPAVCAANKNLSFSHVLLNKFIVEHLFIDLFYNKL